MAPKLVGIAELASKLNVNERTIRRRIDKMGRTLTVIRGKGQKILLTEESAEALVESYYHEHPGVGPVPDNPEVGCATCAKLREDLKRILEYGLELIYGKDTQ